MPVGRRVQAASDTPDLIGSAVAAALAEHAGDVDAATRALIKRAIPDAMALLDHSRKGGRYDIVAHPWLPDILRKSVRSPTEGRRSRSGDPTGGAGGTEPGRTFHASTSPRQRVRRHRPRPHGSGGRGPRGVGHAGGRRHPRTLAPRREHDDDRDDGDDDREGGERRG